MMLVLVKMYNVTIVDANTTEMGENAEEVISVSIDGVGDAGVKSQHEVVGGTISSVDKKKTTASLRFCSRRHGSQI